MIHSTAIVSPGAEIDSDVEIGPFCLIGPKVKIRSGTRLVSHVRVDGRTSIGKNNTVFPFAVLGAVPQDLKYQGEDTELTIGDSNTIRESVTMNLGTIQGGGSTSVGNGNLIMAYVHLGHDCKIQNSCIIANGVQLAGHVTVQDHANIGGLCGVGQFVRVGKHSFSAGCSAIEKDVPPFSVVIGARPCHLKGTNIVGMKRKGFAQEQISRVHESLKLWGNADLPKEKCLNEILEKFGQDPEVNYLVKFIQSSEFGVIR